MLASLYTGFRASHFLTTTERAFSISQIRFRKPRSLGRAPSKEGIYFKKPKPTANDLARGELAYKAYNEMLRSIAAAFQEELLIKGERKTKKSRTFDEEAHHAKCMAYNDEYNAKVRAEREERVGNILERQENDLKRIEQAQELDLMVKLKEFEVEVAEALDEHKNWVTLENMEDKINEALDNIVNYNFSVDRTGKINRRLLMP